MILKCQVLGTRWAPPIVLDIDFVLSCALKQVHFSSKFMSLKKMLSPSKPAFPSPFSISHLRKRILTIKLARPLQSLILTIIQPQQKSPICKSLWKKSSPTSTWWQRRRGSRPPCTWGSARWRRGSSTSRGPSWTCTHPPRSSQYIDLCREICFFITVNTCCECFSLWLLSLLDISMGKLELVFFLIEELSILLLLSFSVVIILIRINPLTKLVFDLRKKEWKSIWAGEGSALMWGGSRKIAPTCIKRKESCSAKKWKNWRMMWPGVNGVKFSCTIFLHQRQQQPLHWPSFASDAVIALFAHSLTHRWLS